MKYEKIALLSVEAQNLVPICNKLAKYVDRTQIIEENQEEILSLMDLVEEITETIRWYQWGERLLQAGN